MKWRMKTHPNFGNFSQLVVMDTTKWGPPGWKFLHAIAYNYPDRPTEAQQKSYSAFFRLLGEVLPCKYCRQSYRRFLRTLPPEKFAGSQSEMFYWSYLIHKKVNDKLRKQGYEIKEDPPYERVCRKFEKWRAKCAKPKGKKGGTCRIPVMEKK